MSKALLRVAARGCPAAVGAAARAARGKQVSPFLATAQAAFYIGLSRRTLEKMRITGSGPAYRKHGRYVRYHIDDLNAWSEARRKTSTSHA